MQVLAWRNIPPRELHGASRHDEAQLSGAHVCERRPSMDPPQHQSESPTHRQRHTERESGCHTCDGFAQRAQDQCIGRAFFCHTRELV